MKNVLLVHDSDSWAPTLEARLRAAGHEVVRTVASEVAAYRAILRHAPDIVVTDQQLGEADAIGVLETLRASALHARVPVVVLASPGDAAMCEAAGADLVLSPEDDTDTIGDAVAEIVASCNAGVPTSAMDANIGECIVTATVGVFGTMMEMQLEPGEVVIEKVPDRTADVIASLQISGFMSGTISMFLSTTFAERAVRTMLMLEPEDVIERGDLIDAVGELMNMVGGLIKTEMFQSTPLFDISVPNVYVGENLNRRSIANDLCFGVPFEFEGETILVEFLVLTAGTDGTTGVQQSLVDSMG